MKRWMALGGVFPHFLNQFRAVVTQALKIQRIIEFIEIMARNFNVISPLRHWRIMLSSPCSSLAVVYPGVGISVCYEVEDSQLTSSVQAENIYVALWNMVVVMIFRASAKYYFNLRIHIV